MSKQAKLTANVRTGVGRGPARRLRASGTIPAVMYGHTDHPRNLEVSQRELSTLLSHAVGEHLLVDLTITEDGKSESHAALLQEVQHHPVSGAIVHVDLLAISMDEKIEAAIPVEPVGEPLGVKSFGGILEQLVRELDISCLPKDLPEVIRVDVTGLNIGDAIKVGDIALPSGVEAQTEAEIAVFLVAAPRVEAEAVATETAAAPEVIKEKKEEAAG